MLRYEAAGAPSLVLPALATHSQGQRAPYGAGCEGVTGFVQESIPPPSASVGHDGRTSRDHAALARRMKLVWSELIEGVVLQLHERSSVAAVHVVTAAALHDGLDGLSCLRKICKAHLFVNWACMINADLVAIGHVSRSH